jgi:hypothetical protein
MTMEEAIGRLKAHEERLGGTGDVDEEHLLLTRSEWKARHEVENSSRGRGRGGCRGRGRGRGRGHACDKSGVKCYNSPNFGHYAYECPQKKNKAFFTKAPTMSQHSCDRVVKAWAGPGFI